MSKYSRNMRHPLSNTTLVDKISMRFVQSFDYRFRIVSRAQKGEYRLSPEKDLQIERAVSCHLKLLFRLMTSGKINENDLSNVEETYFVINIEIGRTLGFVGEDNVKYRDFVLGG